VYREVADDHQILRLRARESIMILAFAMLAMRDPVIISQKTWAVFKWDTVYGIWRKAGDTQSLKACERQVCPS
jgi:hypothetical protein